MQQVTQSLRFTEVDVFEYLLVARPDASVTKKIMAEGERFRNKYQQKAADARPHITIATFTAREPMEDTMLRYMQRICCQQQSFEVALNNYSGLPPSSIFLRIQNPQPFRQLAKELAVVSSYLSSCSCPPARLISYPHVTLAAGLHERVYLKAMMDYSQQTFYETFMVEELVLLRRTNQYDQCKPIHVFRLQPAQDRFLGNLSFN